MNTPNSQPQALRQRNRQITSDSHIYLVSDPPFGRPGFD